MKLILLKSFQKANFSRSSFLDIGIIRFLGSGYRSNPSPIDIDYLRSPLSIV